MILSSGIQRYAGGLSQAPHTHETASVTLLLRGGLRERSGGREVVAGPLSIVIKPAGVIHADLFGPSGVVTCQIVLSPVAHDDPTIRPSIAKWRWVIGGAAVAAGIELASLLANGASAGAIQEASSQVLAALDASPASSAAPAWLERAGQFIDDALASGRQRISVSEVAAVAGVHPVHLARIVGSHLGMTVTAWIRRRRMQRAADLMTRRKGGLSLVAAAAGFADQSHMNRVFKAGAGTLPAEYQRLAASL